MQRRVFLGRLGLWSIVAASLSTNVAARARAAAGPDSRAVAEAFGHPIDAEWTLLGSTRAFSAYYALVPGEPSDSYYRADATIYVSPNPNESLTTVLTFVEMRTPNATATFRLSLNNPGGNRGTASGDLEHPRGVTRNGYGIVTVLGSGTWAAEIASDDARLSGNIVVPKQS
jgi:hypothetical protein